MKLRKGQIAPDFRTEDVQGQALHLHSLKGKKILLSFLRNTNCPLCSLHVFKLARVADELKSKGMELLVFYESAKVMFDVSPFFQKHVFQGQKLRIFSDPQRVIYDQYGAEINAQKATLEALRKGGRLEGIKEARALGIQGEGQEPGTNFDAIPADFLLDENLQIQHAHYGKNAGDNISLEIVQQFAKQG